MPTLVHTSPAGTPSQVVQLVQTSNPIQTQLVPIDQTPLDSTLVDNVSSVAGVSVTAALQTLSAAIAALVAAVAALPPVLGVLVQQLGWNPSSGQTTTLVLLAAGHAAGLYELDFTMIVRTAATGTAFQVQASFTGTDGAENRIVVSGLSWGVLGSLLSNSGARQATIYSTGAAQISIQFQAGVIALGSPVADLFATTRRVA